MKEWDGWMDGWMDGWIDEWVDFRVQVILKCWR
jgi:hypothetical protein